MRELTSALRAWAGAQLIAMAVVGGLTFAGLMLLGLPLAGVLALLAALLGFIPILGPILAGVPAVLLALTESWSLALWTTSLYFAVQIVEGDVITPLIQGRAISLPPGVILVVQVFMLTLFGLVGAALAAPLAAVLLVLSRRLYVEGFVERQPRYPEAGESPDH
jgi:predicted PurR-regulated permease PerM